MAFDVITPVRLAQAAVGVAPTTIYTTPAATRSLLKDIDICNTALTAATINIHIVPVGGTADTTNAIIYGISVPPNGTLQWTGSQVMNAGDFISATASATGITVTASGGEAV